MVGNFIYSYQGVNICTYGGADSWADIQRGQYMVLLIYPGLDI